MARKARKRVPVTCDATASLAEREGLLGKLQCICMREEINAVLAEAQPQS